MTTFNTVFVVGSGTMGAGIAEVVAKAGLRVFLSDQTKELTEKGLHRIEKSLAKAVEKKKLQEEDRTNVLTRIHPLVSIDKAKEADVVIEAIPEKMTLKRPLFAEISRQRPDNLLASNTSSLSLTEIASVCAAPERVIGMHFFNPPPVMRLLELVKADQTSQGTVDRALAFAKTIDKEPILVRDVAGFASSRLGVVLAMEAIRMVESGVASAQDVDRAMELGYKHPMGPLKTTDLIGLDVRLNIAEHLAHSHGPHFEPPILLKEMVREGKLGKKTGHGFYRWESGKPV